MVDVIDTASDVNVRQVTRVNFNSEYVCACVCSWGCVGVCDGVSWWVRDVGRVSEVSFQFRCSDLVPLRYRGRGKKVSTAEVASTTLASSFLVPHSEITYSRPRNSLTLLVHLETVMIKRPSSFSCTNNCI